jgi:hypothetical protein
VNGRTEETQVSTSRSVPDSPILNPHSFLTSLTDLPDTSASRLKPASAGRQALGSAATHLTCSMLCFLVGAALLWHGAIQADPAVLFGGLVAIASAAASGIVSRGWEECDGLPLWKGLLVALPSLLTLAAVTLLVLVVLAVFLLGALFTAGVVTTFVGI